MLSLGGRSAMALGAIPGREPRCCARSDLCTTARAVMRAGAVTRASKRTN